MTVSVNIHLCKYSPIFFSASHSDYSLSAGATAGIVIACFVAFVFCVLIIIAIPIYICYHLGVGIGAAAGKCHTYSDI